MVSCDYCGGKGKIYYHEPKLHLITSDFNWLKDDLPKFEPPVIKHGNCPLCEGTGRWNWKQLPPEVIEQILDSTPVRKRINDLILTIANYIVKDRLR